MFGVLKNITIAAFVLLAAVAIAANIKLPAGYKVLVVSSGSMEPAIGVGSLVLTKPTPDFSSPMPIARFQKGDVITYPATKNAFVSHRVVEVIEKNGQFFYQTKGDANKDPDQKLVSDEETVGRIALVAPYLGRFVNFAKTPLGYFLMILIPSLYVILSEMAVLIGELRKSRAKIPAAGIPLSVVLIFATGFYFIGGTAAYFSDTAVSESNIFTAGQFPQPIATTLVINELLYDSSCSNPEDKFYIEFWNGSGQVVDLKDWKLKDQANNVIQIVNSVTLVNPGQFALITKAQNTWNSNCYGDALSDAVKANLGGNINLGTSGVLRLLDNNNNIVDRVDYGSGSLISGSDRSVERKDRGFDSATGDTFTASDFVVRQYPTPGFGFLENTPVVVNELLPQPSSGQDWVELVNRSASPVDISGWKLDDTTGNMVTIPASTILVAGAHLAVDVANRLNNDGDKVYLRNATNEILDGLSYFKRIPSAGNSIGRSPDGSNTFATFVSPTKGLANP